MTPGHRRSLATQTFRCWLYLIFVVGAQHTAPFLGNRAALSAQTPQKPPLQSKTQKLKNPLNDLLDQAQAAIDNNDFAAAISPLQKFLAEQPDVAYAHFQLAYAFTGLKRAEEARPEYERAMLLDPKMAEAPLNLGILLLERDPAAAVAPLRKAVDMLPSQSRPRVLLGVAQERSGDLAGSVVTFEGAANLDPHDLETLLHLGKLYLAAKRPTDAEPRFRAALEIQPKEPHALLGLAQALDAQKKPETAQAFQDYLATQPADPAAQTRMVHYFLDQQKYDEAIAELDRIDASGKPTLETFKLRADVLIAQKKWGDSVPVLLRAIALSPNDAQLHGGLGRIYLQKRDFPNAEKELRAAIQLDGNNIVYWKDLSSTFYLAGNFPATLNSLDLIAKVEKPGPGVWFIRALCYDKLNQPKPALEAYQKFLELDQDKNPDQVWQAQQRSKVLKRMLEGKK
jgi:Flp pilus assembly protein TadD